MTPRQLLALTPEKIEHDFGYLFGGWTSFMTDVAANASAFTTTVSPRIEIRVYKHHVYDCGRRIWRLAAVFFDGEPVMITQNAGREGDDHAHCFVVDIERRRAMAMHMTTLLCEDPIDDRNTTRVSLDDEIQDLVSFYFGSLNERFDG